MAEEKEKAKQPERNEYDSRKNHDQEMISRQSHYEDIYPGLRPNDGQRPTDTKANPS